MNQGSIYMFIFALVLFFFTCTPSHCAEPLSSYEELKRVEIAQVLNCNSVVLMQNQGLQITILYFVSKSLINQQ